MKRILISIVMVMALGATSAFAENTASPSNPTGGAAAATTSLAAVHKSSEKKKKHHKKKHHKRHGSTKKGTATPK